MIRNIKYIKAFVYVLMSLVCFSYYGKIDGMVFFYFGGLTILNILFMILINYLNHKKEIVVINQTSTKSSILITLFIISLIGSFFLIEVAYLNYTFFSIFWVLLIVFVVVASYWFDYSEGTFYIDKKGFVQPELFNRNYKWSEIKNFELLENQLSFELKGKHYQISLKPDQEANIKLLLSK